MSGGEDEAIEPVEVRVPGPGWGPAVRGLFPDAGIRTVVDDGPDAAPGPRCLVVSREEAGFRLRGGPEGDGGSRDGGAGGGRPRRSGGEDGRGPLLASPGEAIAALELALARTLLRDQAHRVQLHAAGARIGETGVVALGSAGAGKSSLALSWSLDGHPLLGDDAVLVDGEGRARPFRRLVKADVERLSEHGIRPEETHAWEPGWREAWFDPGPAGGWCREACRVGLVALLERRDGGPGDTVEATRLPAPDALAALLESALPSGLTGAASVDPLRRLLDGCRSVRLSYASSRDAARFLAGEAGGRDGTESDGEERA